MTFRLIAALVVCVLAGLLAVRTGLAARAGKREGRILSAPFAGRPVYQRDDPAGFRRAMRLHWFAACGLVAAGLATAGDILAG